MNEYPRGNRYQSPAIRLYQRTVRGVGCWTWMGPPRRGGYGRITVNGRAMPVHRLAWELAFGPIPDGLVVMHKCDNPPCVRPSHLRLGTIADNNADRAEKGRSATGDRHPNRARSPLSYGAAAVIRDMAASGMTHSRIAAQFGVSRSLISLVVEGKRWVA